MGGPIAVGGGHQVELDDEQGEAIHDALSVLRQVQSDSMTSLQLIPAPELLAPPKFTVVSLNN